MITEVGDVRAFRNSHTLYYTPSRARLPPLSVTALILPVHYQKCIINLYFYLSPQVFVDPHELALVLFQALGKLS